MSRGIAFLRQRDKFSVLLSQIRRCVSHRQVQILLELQLAGDRWFIRRYLRRDFEILWVREMESWIEKAFQALEEGQSMMPILTRIVHLYGHLFRQSLGRY